MKILFLILFFSLPVFAESACEHLKDDCEYYSCLSHLKHCSDLSYPENFGKRYCLRYADRMSSFSETGKNWIQSVKKCLIREMEGFESKLSCPGLRNRAFQSHVTCYVESGFCGLSFHDKKQILRTIWPSIRNVQILANGINVLRACR
jgi:hypothetical protein